MFSKIGEFIKPPAGPRDTVPSGPAESVRPVNKDQQAGQEKFPHGKSAGTQTQDLSADDKSAKAPASQDAVLVSLEAIRVTLLGFPASSSSSDPAQTLLSPAVAAYQRGQKPSVPDREDVPQDIAQALGHIDALQQAGIAAIPVPEGMDFQAALLAAVQVYRAE